MGVRPAFADNLPRVERNGRRIRTNGLYRHGFLVAPAMASQAKQPTPSWETVQQGSLPLKLNVNGQRHEVAAETLAALLIELDFQGSWLATALNGDVVPAKERDSCRLADGDRVEILSPMKGG